MTPKHTLIYPQKQDAGRAQSRPPGATMGGPVPKGPRSQARASSGPCPASLTALPLEGDPRPSRAEEGKSLRLSRFQDLPKINTSGLIPSFFQFSRIEFRWDFLPGRGHISVRLALGLRKLPQASRSPQRARIRDGACLPCMCQTPPGGADRVFHASSPSRGVVSCAALGLPGHPPQGGCPTLPPQRGVA